MYLLDLVALYITPQQTSVAFGYIRLVAASCDTPPAGECGSSWQKPRFLPAETKSMSEKRPQASFSNEPRIEA
jgi:hypothetical protein